MGKYDGIKNPALTDEEFEVWQQRGRAEAHAWLAVHDGSQPGDFLGYFCCPTCHANDIHNGVELLRPATGDLVVTCAACGTVTTFALPQHAARILDEGFDVL